MADKVSATISYLDSNQRKGMKAITDINPTADNSAVKSLCTGLNALTTNTLQGIEKIERTDITNATVKPKLQLTLGSGTAVLVMKNMNTGASTTCELFSETNLPPFTYKVQSTDEFSCANFVVCLFTGVMGLTVSAVEDERLSANPAPVTVTIYFEETATTAATTAQVVFSYNNNPALTIL